MQTTEKSLKTSGASLQNSETLTALKVLIDFYKPNEPASEEMLTVLNKALKECEVKGGEVTTLTRGEFWQFQDVYKYLYTCVWRCGSMNSCKYQGMGAEAHVADGRLFFRYVGCDRYFSMKRAFRWITNPKNKDVLKAARSFEKDLKDFTIDEWKAVLGNKWHDVVSGRFDE
jgi:hypothetical protein